jgi:CheY-like chemotaxis protein
MAAAKPALAPITVNRGDKELLRIEPNELFRILYVEDSEDVRTGICEIFESEGYGIDAVPTPSEAVALLEPDKYQLVIVDISFAPPNISGDEFVLKNKDMFESAKKVAFTGYAGKIKYNDLFNEVIVKGKNQTLFDFAQKLYIERELELTEKIEDSAKSLLEGDLISVGNYQVAEEKIRRLQTKLISELEKVKNKDKILVSYEGQGYSAKNLIDEIKKGSELGKAHIGMMLDLVEKNG